MNDTHQSPPARAANVIHSALHWLRQRPITLGIIASLIALYAIIGFWWIPKLAGQAATDYVEHTLHRQLKMGELRFNPFTFTATLRKVKLSEADGELLIGFDELLVNAELSSLIHGAYTFKEIRWTAPVINAALLQDGTLNLAALANSDADPEKKSSGPLPAIRIGRLTLQQGQVHFEDRSKPTVFAATLTPIEFTLDNFRTQPDFDNAFHFSARSAAGETMDWRGNFELDEQGAVAANGALQIGNLQAGTIQSYLQDALPFRLLSGVVNLQGSYRVALKAPLDMKLELPSIQLKDTQVAPRDDSQADAQPWVTLPQVDLRDTVVSLHERSVSIKDITGNKAQLTLWLDAQRNLNLLQLLGPDEPSDAPWKVQVASLHFNDMQVHAEDRAVKPAAQFALDPLQLTISNFSTSPGSIIDLDTHLRLNAAADIGLQGTVALDTLESKLKLAIKTLPLNALQSYAAASTDMVINNGSLDADGDLYYKGKSTGKEPQLRFGGDAKINALATQDVATHQDFIKWDALQLNGLKYSMAPDEILIREVHAQRPYGRVAIDSNGMTNIAHILRTPSASNTTAADRKSSAAAPATRIRIARVLIDNGFASFSDHSVTPSFATDIEQLHGSVTGLSTVDSSRAMVKLSGTVDRYAPMSLEGEANFLSASAYSDLAMKISNMELTTFNPYTGKFAGYAIAKGKLSTDIRYQIRERKLDAQHHITIDQLEFGDAIDSKEAVSLPVKLAAALLKDRHGVIDLDLPVGGSLDDPTFKVGPIIWKACVNLLTKIVTSPFKALGALFGGGEEMSYVDFAPGSTVVSDAEKQKLGTLAKALVERPQLKLNIPLTVVTDVDAAVLNQAAFDQALATQLPAGSNASPAQRLQALTSLYQSKAGKAPEFPPASQPAADVTAEHNRFLQNLLLPYFAIGIEERNALTRQRADAVQAVVLANTEISAERVFLTARTNEAKSPEGVSRMALKLE